MSVFRKVQEEIHKNRVKVPEEKAKGFVCKMNLTAALDLLYDTQECILGK